MKTKTTISKLQKTLNVTFDMNEKIPSVVFGKCVIELYRNGEEDLAFVIVRRLGDNDDSLTDYFGGIYCKTIKRVIETASRYNEAA
jgi:hypothetical protein